MSADYVLGDNQEELSRLKLQHDLWRSELLNLWEKTHLKQSHKTLDLGCGPGFTSLDILQYNPQTQLTSVDISENFLNYLNHEAKELNKNYKIITHKSYIEELELPSKDYDIAFCRWLMIFVQNPQKAIKQVHQHLKSGGQFIMQEYVSYETMDLVPDSEHMKPVVDAIFKSWKDQGGDPNRGRHLPRYLEACGFKVSYLEPVAKFARPNDPLWQWPDSFYKIFLPRLQKTDYLTEKQVSDFFNEWEEAKTNPGSFFIAPMVINIIAEKI